MTKLILASGSPRRAALLQQAGLSFEVIRPQVCEEAKDNLSPEELVLKTAENKACNVRRQAKSGMIVAADTVVVYQGKIFGKPQDRPEAKKMLKHLSGSKHHVYTGLILLNAASGVMKGGVEKTAVWMKTINPVLLERYLDSQEPFDKAGAYAIQGRAALFIKKIEGCYTNVVGLPLSLLFDLVEEVNLFVL